MKREVGAFAICSFFRRTQQLKQTPGLFTDPGGFHFWQYAGRPTTFAIWSVAGGIGLRTKRGRSSIPRY
jgi:hypothetical protein